MRLQIGCQTRRPEARRGRPRKWAHKGSDQPHEVSRTPSESASISATVNGSAPVGDPATIDSSVPTPSDAPPKEVSQQGLLVHPHASVGLEELTSSIDPSIEANTPQIIATQGWSSPARLLDEDVDLSAMSQWLEASSVQHASLGIYSILDATDLEETAALTASLTDASFCAGYSPLSYAVLAINLQMTLNHSSSTELEQSELLIDTLRI